VRTIVPISCDIRKFMNDKNINWEKIKNEYITTNTSYTKLAKKYGISCASIKVKGSKEKWVQERKKHVKTTQEKTLEKNSDDKAESYEDLEQLILDFEKKVIVDSTNKWIELTNHPEEGEIKHKYSLQKTIESALNNIHKIKYPPDKEKKDEKTVFVVPESFKKVFN